MQNDIWAMPRSNEQHAGMPILDETAHDVSWFEFAPMKLFYTPVALYCAWLSMRHMGITLPTNSNPGLPYSGLVGESKNAVLNQVTGVSRDWISPYILCLRWSGNGGADKTLKEALHSMKEHSLAFPLVAKPDLGMRGAGVQVVKSEEDLLRYIKAFPQGANFMLQALINEEGEAGIYYVRHPDQEKGEIISLTLKYFPRVYGDGKTTLKQLIKDDPRAGKLAHLYFERFRGRLNEVIAEGDSVRLAFAGNHSAGTIFRNGENDITNAMRDTFDEIAKSMGEFYVGRFDIRFGDFNALKQGYGFRIIEVNGAGGEPTHIWDSRTTIRSAYSTLFSQYKHLYAIGAKNRARGFKPNTPKELINAWWHEKQLTTHYPNTH
ncbi:hypothetical protein [Kordiimonas sp. SCSIO 12610]|uniref:hypothetical protein n=1 Tax=Kordiimonas sp. SCSIO 12610 TaxID=2829597 RepID=UPI00210C1840|nr:hypothetical protein [Kordiimonas sp. SCSIO 12610]UTW55014.1 hypothetical protein KFF44_14585 [Kordiimonas sp. SCSIO 12610]